MARAVDPVLARAAAVRIVATLRAAGHVAYFAGGCVRDELLGLSPTDYDVATDATPDRVRASFRRTHEVGEAFGVMLVPGDGATTEVATFRADGEYSDQRRPDAVRFADVHQDARRRDFTINALYLDPLAAPAEPAADASATFSPMGGKVIDLVGGIADLRAGVLRAVGDPNLRLAEDHLRALRAARFAARLGFFIDPATAEAVRRHAQALAGVSRERIGQEVARMMAHPARARAAALMQELHLDAPALGEPHRTAPIVALAAIGAGVRADPSGGACLAAWAIDRHGVEGVMLEEDAPGRSGGGAGSGQGRSRRTLAVVARWRVALCLSNADRDAMADTLRIHHALSTRWAEFGRLGIAAQKRLAADPSFSDALALVEGRDPALAESILAKVRELRAHGPGLAPEPLISGDDLVLLGYRPHPVFKTLLDRLYDAQLEGRLETKSQALAHARELAAELGV